MRWGRRGSVLAAILPVLVACGGEEDAYLTELKRRCARLVPHVERETGREMGDVEILVRPREEFANSVLPWAREQLARVENGPRGDVLEADARRLADGWAHGASASVDPRGRIVVPDPKEEREGLLEILMGSWPRSEFAKDPRHLDLILLHELVHVHQHRHLETPAFFESIHSRADLWARRAVFEGHAEYLTRRIASRIGLAEVYEKYHRGLTEAETPWPNPSEWYRRKLRVSVPEINFAYVQGERFIAAVVDRLGYEKAVRKIFADPPSLAQVSRPEEYFQPREPSPWGPVVEDLRRWLALECEEASLEALALPMVREATGDPAADFREGYRLSSHGDVVVHVLVADSAAGARRLQEAWIRGLEARHALAVKEHLHFDVRRIRDPDRLVLHYFRTGEEHVRRTVVRDGVVVVDIEREPDSEREQGAERLARRACKLLTDATWRAAWLAGGNELLESEDPDLRLAAVRRMSRFVADEDWEVRCFGRLHEALLGEEAALAAALADEHPAVVTRVLRAMGGQASPGRLRKHLTSDAACVRRAAWAIVEEGAFGESQKDVRSVVSAGLEDDDVVVRRRATRSLSHLFETEGLADLYRKALTDAHREVRREAVVTMSIHYFDPPELVPELTAQLDENPEEAAEVLGRLGEAAKPALPKLRETLADPRARDEAAEAIWLIGGDVRPLLALVRESVAEGRPQGLEAAGHLGQWARPVVSSIATALTHENMWIRGAAAEALGRIGGDEAKKALEERLAVEKDGRVLERIREALEKLR